MNKKLFKELRKKGMIDKIDHPYQNGNIECPGCSNKMLCPWSTNRSGGAFLCYECGSLFLLSGRVLKKHKGNPRDWAELTGEYLHEYDQQRGKYKHEGMHLRRKEYSDYLRERLRDCGICPNILSQLSDDEVLENYRVCGECQSEFYTEGEQDFAICEFDSPVRTFEVLHEYEDKHHFETMLNQTEYQELSIGEDTWRAEGFDFAWISPEIREHLLKLLSKEFRRWVDEPRTYFIDHSEDPKWDCSGRLVTIAMQQSKKLELAGDTIEGWFDAFTGGSYASYESGCGIFHERYGDIVDELIQDALYNIWFKKFSAEDKDATAEDEKFVDQAIILISQFMSWVAKMHPIQLYRISDGSL